MTTCCSHPEVFASLPTPERSNRIAIEESGSYHKELIQIIKSNRQRVELECDLGDELVSGTCESSNPLGSYFESLPEIQVDSFEINSKGKRTFVCKAHLVGRIQVIKLTSSIVCKKHIEASKSASAQASNRSLAL